MLLSIDTLYRTVNNSPSRVLHSSVVYVRTRPGSNSKSCFALRFRAESYYPNIGVAFWLAYQISPLLLLLLQGGNKDLLLGSYRPFCRRIHPIMNNQVEERPTSSLPRGPVDFDMDPLTSQDISSSSSSSADEFLVDDDYSARSSSSSNSCSTTADADDDGRDSTPAVKKLAHTTAAVGGAEVLDIASQGDHDKERVTTKEEEPRTRTTTQVSASSSSSSPSNHTTTNSSAASAAAKLDRYYPPHRWPGKWAVSMARRPCLWFSVAWFVTLTLSVVGIIVGDFQVAVDNAGWTSRGTLIADRTTQIELVLDNLDSLTRPDNGARWNDLLNNVQEGWEEGDDDDEIRVDDDEFSGTSTTPEQGSRRRMSRSTRQSSRKGMWQSNGAPRWNSAGLVPSMDPHRHLQDNENVTWTIPGLSGCDTNWYVYVVGVAYSRGHPSFSLFLFSHTKPEQVHGSSFAQ